MTTNNLYRQIVAIDGGGFSMEPRNPRLDKYILEVSNQKTSKICFLPTASSDSDKYIVKFYSGFHLNQIHFIFLFCRDLACKVSTKCHVLNRKPLYLAFSRQQCKPSHLSLFQPHTADLRSFLLEQDVIYVGGGNTKNLMALWKEWELDRILREAWEKGVILTGLSAGLIEKYSSIK